MDSTMAKPRMLTIKETAKTGVLTEWAIRGLVKQGKVPGIYIDNRFLVNYDRFIDWLNEQNTQK